MEQYDPNEDRVVFSFDILNTGQDPYLVVLLVIITIFMFSGIILAVFFMCVLAHLVPSLFLLFFLVF